jgi:hypothetical protein
MSVVEKGKKLFSGVFAKKNPYQSEADNAQEGMRSLETLISANTAKLKGIASQIDALFCGAATMDRMSQEFKNVRMRGDALLLERKSMEAQLEQYRNAWSEKARISGLLSQAEISKQMDVFTVDVAKMGALISNAADEKAERDAKARELSGILAMGESGLLSTDSLTAQPVSEFDKLFDEQLVAATPKVTPTQPEPSLFEAMMNPSIQNDNPQKDAETPSAIPLDI